MALDATNRQRTFAQLMRVVGFPGALTKADIKAAVDAAFAKAAHVTKLDIVNNRLVPNAIEPRAAVASYSRADDAYTLYVTSQNPHVERLLMTAFVLGLPEHKVPADVITPSAGANSHASR